ncbi:MAG: DUF4340 domain-containing protein [Deltaproteobacteria bacterium]|nr:DUF4340 domain-containing protein [Deltaproteobacteria bacterium]
MGRTTIVLGVITVIMAAFILFFERDAITSRELDKRKGHLIQKFVRDRVQKLEIESEGKNTVLVKTAGGVDELDEHGWRLVRPWAADADESEVDSLLSTLEWMDSKRILENIGEADRKRFGLDKPKVRAWYTIGSRRMPIVLGKRDARGFGYYLQLDDPARAYIVNKEIYEALSRDPAEFYTKKLHDGVSAYSTGSIVIRDENGEKRVEKRKGDYWMTKPSVALASSDAVEGLIDGIDRLKATRFISEKVDDLARYGLEAPVLEAVIQPTVSNDKEKKEAKKQALQIRIGAKCGERDNESYVLVGEHKPVMCVSDESLEAVRKAVETLRDKRLLPLRESEVEAVRIDAGKRRLELDFDKSKWSYQAYIDKRVVAKGEADTDAVERWLERLRAVEMSASTPFDEEISKTRGISKPQASVRFIRSKKEPELLLSVGVVQGETLYVRRADEPWVASFPASALELLEATSAHFRRLKLLDDTGEELVELTVKREGVTEKAKKEGGNDWRIIEPINAKADRAILDELGRLFSQLEAVRFVADIAEPIHGLDNPAAVITAGYSKADHESSHEHGSDDLDKKASKIRSTTLKIGNAVDGGRFAQFGKDQAVFVVSQALFDYGSQPLVSRTLVDYSKEQINGVKIEKGKEVIEARRQDRGFRFLDGKGTQAQAEQLVERLTQLRASRAMAYGTPTAEEGIDRPRLRISVTSTGEKAEPRSIQLLVGNNATAKEEEERQVFIRRSDISAAFTIALDEIEKLANRAP